MAAAAAAGRMGCVMGSRSQCRMVRRTMGGRVDDCCRAAAQRAALVRVSLVREASRRDKSVAAAACLAVSPCRWCSRADCTAPMADAWTTAQLAAARLVGVARCWLLLCRRMDAAAASGATTSSADAIGSSVSESESRPPWLAVGEGGRGRLRRWECGGGGRCKDNEAMTLAAAVSGAINCRGEEGEGVLLRCAA